MTVLPPLDSRAPMYDLLSRLYLVAPSTPLLKALQDAEPADELRRYLDPKGEISGNLNRLVEDLGVEFCRLFIGPPAVVRPYESLFLAVRHQGEGAGQFGNPACRVLRAFYANENFQPPVAFEGLPDHLGVELSFMSHASYLLSSAAKVQAQESLSSVLNSQMHFLEEHLANWVPRFCRSIEEHTTSPFYAGLASLTRDYICTDRKQVEVLAHTYSLVVSR